MEINEKKLKNILEQQRKKTRKEISKDMERYIGVLKEDFDSKVRLIAESVSGIQEQLIAIRDMVVKNTEDIEMIKIDMEAMKSDINIIKNDLK